MRISDWSSDVCSSDLLFFWFFIHPRGTRRVACAGSGGSPCPGGRETLFPPQDIPRLRGGRLCPASGARHPWRLCRGPPPPGHGTRGRCADSEMREVGNECVTVGRYLWCTVQPKKNQQNK